MAQHDYVIANDTAANVRADINNALAAIASNNSGASAPATTYANQWWYDTTNDILKIRNEADTAWINLATVNQTDGRVEFVTLFSTNLSDGTTSLGTEYVVNGSAKAWWHYEQATTTVSDSFNVSSITDDAVGEYTVNLTNNMANANYSVSFGSGPLGGSQILLSAPTVSAIEVDTTNRTGTAQDAENGTGAVQGDVA